MSIKNSVINFLSEKGLISKNTIEDQEKELFNDLRSENTINREDENQRRLQIRKEEREFSENYELSEDESTENRNRILKERNRNTPRY